VLGTPERPTHIRVRWPGGKVTVSAVPDKAREIVVEEDGKATVKR